MTGRDVIVVGTGGMGSAAVGAGAGGLDVPMVVERQVTHWVAPAGCGAGPRRCCPA